MFKYSGLKTDETRPVQDIVCLRKTAYIVAMQYEKSYSHDLVSELRKLYFLIHTIILNLHRDKRLLNVHLYYRLFIYSDSGISFFISE